MPLTERPCALVVDDDMAVRLSTAMLLSAMGVDPSVADAGRSALEQVSSRHFDLAFVDLGLPDIDGAVLAQQLHLIAPMMAIVMVSGDHRRLIEMQAAGRHALDKPVSVTTMRRTILELLS